MSFEWGGKYIFLYILNLLITSMLLTQSVYMKNSVLQFMESWCLHTHHQETTHMMVKTGKLSVFLDLRLRSSSEEYS